jgi:ABC-2 type transport system ATP-binding protein
MSAASLNPIPLLSVRGLTKRYGGVTAIRDVSFTTRAGEILGVVGPNGAGKTTLFECLAGVQPADSPAITFPADAPRSRMLFYVPDGIAPWPQQRVGWVLEFAIGFFGGRAELYDDVVRQLRLEPLLGVRIAALSKGQRKRVLLAVALLAPQPLLVVDEPFEGLDLRQSREVEQVLRTHAAAGRTLLVSIHQIADASRICDRFVLLSGGSVVAEGTLVELAALALSRDASVAADDFEEIFLALT